MNCKAITNISISDVLMKHGFLVGDIMDEIILWMDFMAKHGFVLNMKRRALQYANVTLVLTVGCDTGVTDKLNYCKLWYKASRKSRQTQKDF